MFSIVTVASSTRMPTASARPPSVMMFSVSPNADRIDDRAENRQRNRDGDDHRRAPAAEEQQDHQAGQCGGDDAFLRHAADRVAHEDRLIADRLHFEVVGHRRLHRLDHRLHAVDDIERRRRAAFQHGHQHRTSAVDVNDVGLHRAAVADVGDVAHIHHRAVHRFDRQVGEVFQIRRRGVEIDRVFERADLLRADRREQILRGERVGHVLAGESARLQRIRIEIDLHLARLAAERIRNRRARHGDQARAQAGSSRRSASVCSVNPFPDSASCRIGTVDAL